MDMLPEIDLGLDEFLHFSTSQYVGGGGDDVLGAGGSGGDLVGGQGDDTYLFTFGYDGDHIADEAGLDSARNWADALGIDDGIIDDITGGGGGNDVVEIRGWGTLFELGPDNLSFTVEDGEDLVIGMQTENGTGLSSMGSITLKNMHEEENRIETLRIVNADGYKDYDLSAAWENADFDIFKFETASGEKAGTSAIFDELAMDWLETTMTGFENVPLAGALADDVLQIAGDIASIQAPETKDMFEFI